MNRKNKEQILKLTYAGLCLALALVLPFLTGQIPEIGQALSPMHIPALLCGFLCGPVWGLAVGAVAPIMRSMIFGMPPMVAAIPMAFELATYGFATGALYRVFGKKTLGIYPALICSMIAGRIVWGIVKWVMAVAGVAEFGFSAFIAGAVTTALPGIICHIVLVPIIVLALKKAALIK